MIVPPRDKARRSFQDCAFSLARRIKTIRARYAQNLQITRGLLRPSLRRCCTFKHARQLIQPAVLQTGVSTLSSFEVHADIMFAAASPGKCWANERRGDNERDGQLHGLMALQRLRPALTRVPQCTFVSVRLYSDDPSASRPLFSIPHLRHNALLSPINPPTINTSFAGVKKEIFALTAAITRAWMEKLRCEVTVRKYLLYFQDFFKWKLDDRIIFQSYHV